MRLIWTIIILLIGYGSLYPFNFDWSRQLPIDLMDWMVNWEQRTIRSDLIANILLFIPYGFFGVLTIQQDSRRSPIISIFGLLLAGVVYALFLQFLQFFLPSRVPHAADAIINSIGILLGIMMAAYTNSQRIRRLIPQKLQFRLTPALLILALWVAWAFFPYSPVFEGTQLEKGIKTIYQSNWQLALWVKYGLFWLIFYYSLSRVMERHYQVSILLAISVFVVAIKLSMFRSQLGWSEMSAIPMALLIYRYLSAQGQVMLIAIGALGILVWEMLFPWQLHHSLDSINHIQWTPFKAFLGGSTWQHLSRLLALALLVSSLGYALARWLRSFKKSAFAMLIIILIISSLQLFVVGKQPDITNVILVVLMAFLLERIDRIRA